MPSLFQKIDHYFNRKTGNTNLSEEVAACIRAEQLAATTNLTPAMMLGNSVLLAGILAIELSIGANVSIYVWCAVLGLLIFASLKSWYHFKDKKLNCASVRARNSIIKNAAILGIMWAILPIIMFMDGNAAQKTIVAAGVAGMICGAGFALASIPQAAAIFIFPLVVSSSMVLLAEGRPMDILTLIVLWTYTIIVMIASLQHASVFVGRITARFDAERRSDTIGLLLKDFEESSSDWLWHADKEGKFTKVSSRFAQAAAKTQCEIEQTFFTELFANEIVKRTDDYKTLLTAIGKRLPFRMIEVPVNVDGTLRWWSVTGQPAFGRNKRFKGYDGVAADITEKKIAEKRSEYLAQNDPLTGLYNRSKFLEILHKNVSETLKNSQELAVFYLDLDMFKVVNDTKGHCFGDRLLTKVADRIRSNTSACDIISRLGGDEFAIIVKNASTRAKAALAAEKLCRAISEQYDVEGEALFIESSIGIAMIGSDGTNSDTIMRNADLAMYRAKADAKGTFRFFEQEMDTLARRKRQIEFELAKAIDKDQLLLKFQPLVQANDRSTKGFEALIRWHHPELGEVSPVEFIPIAERSGLIHQIGEWVVNEALRVASNWDDHLTVSVNLSAVQIEDGNLFEIVVDSLERNDIKPSRLDLEITEGVVLGENEEILKTLRKLKNLGVSISMDDFGTGYSSLSYLTVFPFDRIKIDRSFVAMLETDVNSRAILETIGVLGQTMNMDITAEGVEKLEQINFLKSISCDLFQGYYFSKPLHEVDIAAFLIKEFNTGAGKEIVAKAS